MKLFHFLDFRVFPLLGYSRLLSCCQALQTGKMGVVRLREALRQRVCESSPDALALLHPIDLVEAMKGMAVKLDVADSEKVSHTRFGFRGFIAIILVCIIRRCL